MTWWTPCPVSLHCAIRPFRAERVAVAAAIDSITMGDHPMKNCGRAAARISAYSP